MTINSDTFKKQLHGNGFTIIPELSLPLSSDETAILNSLTENNHLNYQVINRGDTQEETSVNCGRIKYRNKDNVEASQIIEILNSHKFISFLSNVTGIKQFYLERIQSHIYYTEDFIGKHVDSHSVPSYAFSGIIHFNSEYEGGEFVAYFDEEVSIKPKGFALILLNSKVPHEVKKITSGKRKTLVFFMNQEPNQ